MTKCAWHLCQNEAKVKYCSVKCKNKGSVNNFRKEQKRKAVEYKGGKCYICGYSKCQEALHFHHLDPKEKNFGIGEKGHTRIWEEVKKELDKCVCLCSNCHSEVHAGITNIG
jgi:hypothetical protein